MDRPAAGPRDQAADHRPDSRDGRGRVASCMRAGVHQPCAQGARVWGSGRKPWRRRWRIGWRSSNARSRHPTTRRLASLFHADSYWRDVLALTWRIQTVGGADAIVSELDAHAARARPSGFRIDPRRTPPRRVTRAGTEAIEAIFCFETAEGRGSGVVRLTPDAEDGTLKAWTLLTALDAIKGHEEQLGRSRPAGQGLLARFPRPQLARPQERRRRICRPRPRRAGGRRRTGRAVDRRAPRRSCGVDTLIVDREPRIGDNWRKRYHALILHNQVHVNHLPYMPFPPSWPAYIPKDKLANWFEAYADSMELNYWTGTEFEGGSYDEAEGAGRSCCVAPTARERTMRPRHVVMATGVSGIPSLPDIPSLTQFRRHGAALQPIRGRRGVEGQARARHRHRQQRPRHRAGPARGRRDGHAGAAQLDPDRQRRAERAAPLRALRRRAAARGLRPDHGVDAAPARAEDARPAHRAGEAASTRTCSTSSRASGFKLDFGEDGTGWQFKYLTRGGGYYFNVGCSDLIVEGEIGLAQFSDIAEFTADGRAHALGRNAPRRPDRAGDRLQGPGAPGAQAVRRRGRRARRADLGIRRRARSCATCSRRTAQPGLWFIAGSFAQCRIYSKYLGLQIKACEIGLLPRDDSTRAGVARNAYEEAAAS